jgi:hypothetical protein
MLQNMVLRILVKGLYLYGEIYGAGIQKNYDYGFSKNSTCMGFDVMLDGEYMPTYDAWNIIT